jgi:hypothetical protein
VSSEVAASSALQPAGLGDPSTFLPLPPTRIADTRNAAGGIQGPIASDTTVSFQVRGVAGVPIEATSVVLNVTAVDPQNTGYFTIYPSGTPRPGSSSLNFVPGRNVANVVVARIGDDGKVSLYNFGGLAEAIFDVTGYFVTGISAGRFYGTIPFRLVDTRSTPRTDGSIIPVGPGVSMRVTVRNTGLPADIHWSAVLVNITATNATSGGYLTAYPTGDALPLASNLNFKAGQTVANAAIIKLGPTSSGGSGITIFNAFGYTDVIVDVMGVFDDGILATGFSVPTAFRALDQPVRIVDTRPTASSFGHETRLVGVAGAGGAPLGALGVMLNATVTNTTAPSYLSIWPPQLPQPVVSSLNWGPDETVPNFVGVFIASGGASPGTLSIYNDAGQADLLLDITGYFYRVT